MSLNKQASVMVCLVFICAGHAARAECRQANQFKIEVEVSADPVETVFDTSLEELARLAHAAGRDAHTPLRAVYGSTVVFRADIQSEVRASDVNTFCAIARSIHIRVAIGKREIHAARELRERPCLLAAARDHALAHAQYQQKNLGEAKQRMSSSLMARLQRGMPETNSASEAERILARAVSAQIDSDLAEIDAEGTESGRAPDSPEVLARLRDICPAEQADLLRERT